MGDVLARWLYGILEKRSRAPNSILYNSAVRDDLRTLEPTKNTAKRQKEYVLSKLSLCSLIMIIGVILSVVMWIKEASDTKIVDINGKNYEDHINDAHEFGPMRNRGRGRH